MEEAPSEFVSPTPSSQPPSRQLFLLSARHKAGAQQIAANLREYLESSQEKFSDRSVFENLAYTLTERRTRFPWTIAVSAEGPSDLITALSDTAIQPIQRTETPPRLGLVFNGQGAQWFAMGRELSAFYPVYKETLEECDEIIKSFGSDWSLVEELGRDEKTSCVNEVKFSMPLSCAVQLALVQLLREFGIIPAAVTGHSSGEIAAAFAAGALSLRDAMAATYFRGLVTAQHLATATKLTPGGMLAVGLGASDAQPYVDAVTAGKVVIACENSPSSVTLSGDMEGIEELAAKFTAENIFARKLLVQTAFHSHHMLPLEKGYHAALEQHMSKRGKPMSDVLFVSPVTGEEIKSTSQLGPEHWVENMTHPVLFSDSFRNMVTTEHPDGTIEQNVETIIEVGPHSALAGPIRQSLKAVPTLKGLSVAYGSCLERGKNAVLTIQNLVGFLVSKGYPVKTSLVNTPNEQKVHRVVPGLPSYPWNHTNRFWHESRISNEHRFREHSYHDLLGARLTGTSDRSPVWRHIIRAGEVSHIKFFTLLVMSAYYFRCLGFVTILCRVMLSIQEQDISQWQSKLYVSSTPLPSQVTSLKKSSYYVQPSFQRTTTVLSCNYSSNQPAKRLWIQIGASSVYTPLCLTAHGLRPHGDMLPQRWPPDRGPLCGRRQIPALMAVIVRPWRPKHFTSRWRRLVSNMERHSRGW
jgi:acyl transferase domain-containing protein